MSGRGRGWVRHSALGVVLAAYVCAASVLVLWPDGERVRRALLDVYFFAITDLGLPSWGGPEGYARIGNVLLFAPLAGAITLYTGWRRWWLATLTCGLLSVGAEWAQTRTGMQRVPEWSDVRDNVTGAFVAAVLIAAWLRVRGRDPRGDEDDTDPGLSHE